MMMKRKPAAKKAAAKRPAAAAAAKKIVAKKKAGKMPAELLERFKGKSAAKKSTAKDTATGPLSAVPSLASNCTGGR